MKKLSKILLVICPLLFIGAGCEEESLDLPVNFEFQLFDEQRNPSTAFKEDENFLFSFNIINSSEEQIQFDQTEMQTKDFFRVFMITDSQEEGSTIDMGKPYEGIFCLYLGSYTISAKDTLSLQIPWRPDENWDLGDVSYFSPFFCDVNSDNQLLDKGIYQTKFSSGFKFSVNGNELSLPTQDFKIDFTIE